MRLSNLGSKPDQPAPPVWRIFTLVAPLLLTSGLLLAACAGDQTVAAFVQPGATYSLRSLDGSPFPGRATIRFGARGQVTGSGPCNSFAAEQTAPYPWFELGPLRATRKACAGLADERRYFRALGQMSLSETSGNVLILQDDTGREMVFRAGEAGGNGAK